MLFINSVFICFALWSYFSRDYSVLLLFEETLAATLFIIFPEAEFLFLSPLSFCNKLLLAPLAVRSVRKGFSAESDPLCLIFGSPGSNRLRLETG